MFFVGIIFAILVVLAIAIIINKKISVRWYEWLIFAIGVSLLIFTTQNFFASFVENESRAAWIFLLVLGLPALIIVSIPITLALRRVTSK